MKWQPIETAPKDGKEIILTDGHDVGGGFYSDESNYRSDPGFFWEMDRGNLLIAKNAYPTHWMPLPEPPEQENP